MTVRRNGAVERGGVRGVPGGGEPPLKMHCTVQNRFVNSFGMRVNGTLDKQNICGTEIGQIWRMNNVLPIKFEI